MPDLIGLIGPGKMGLAIAEGLASRPGENAVWIGARSEESAARAAGLTDYPVLVDYEARLHETTILILATRPGDLRPCLEALGQMGGIRKDMLLISVAAGITTEMLEEWTGCEPIPFIRAMPNMLSRYGRGMTILERGRHALGGHMQSAASLFSALGETLVQPSAQMNAATALAASGPAFAFAILDALVNAGIALSLSAPDATRMAGSVLAGAAQTVMETGHHPREFIRGVTTPGGCTIAGLLELEAAGLPTALHRTLATTARAAAGLGGPVI